MVPQFRFLYIQLTRAHFCLSELYFLQITELPIFARIIDLHWCALLLLRPVPI